MSEISNHKDTGPFAMGRVALTVNDLPSVSDYYQKSVGLHLFNSDGETAILGAGNLPLLELRQDKAARRRYPQEAGLFHTAFLLPQRADLAGWVQHAIDTRVPVAGASDHYVSEALYLQDPEGNGIEIYADRPETTWQWNGSDVSMGTEQLDIADLLSARADKVWSGFPEGSVVGHVHLQVGDTNEAESFFVDGIGLDLTARYPGGSFFSANGYHHHIAANTWNSRRAGKRNFPSTGLADMEILAGADRAEAIAKRLGTTLSGGQLSLTDPWGTPVTLTIR